MGIRRFFDQDIVVSRLRVLGGDRRGYSSTATVEGHIQELDTEARQALGIIEERGWTAYFDVNTDINEQDRLTDENGVVYVVREITKKDYGFAVNTHLEVILMEQNE